MQPEYSHVSDRNNEDKGTHVKPKEYYPHEFYEEEWEIGDDNLPEFVDHRIASNQFQDQNGGGCSNSKNYGLDVNILWSRMKKLVHENQASPGQFQGSG